MSLPLRTLIALPLTLLACASTRVPDECRGRCLDGGQIGADGGPNGAYPDLPEGPKPDVLPPTGEWPPVREGAQTCTLPAAPEVSEMEVEEVFPALDFTRPLFFGYANDGSERRYVAEQGGRVWVFEGRPDVEGAQLFFEVPVSRSNNEEGLLGLAFHPAYAQNGKAYVYYSTPPENGERQTVLAEYRRAADGLTLDPGTARLLLTVPQPYGNHKGGALLFGPDGFLYLGLGDGGAGGDPHIVIFNTARANFDDKNKFLGTFKKHGINMKGIHVIRAGNINQEGTPAAKKATVIHGYISKHKYKDVHMYDDSKSNLKTFLTLRPHHPNTSFHAYHVQGHDYSKYE